MAETGFLEITEGKTWKPGEAITTAGLDGTAQPVAKIAPASIGRREIDPDQLARIVASSRGGLPFKGRTAAAITLNPHTKGFAVLSFNAPGALTSQVPLMAAVDFGKQKWTAFVSAADTINVMVRNLSSQVVTIPKGTKFFGKLL